MVLSGGSSNKNKYTKKEDCIINFANSEINKLYDFKTNKKDYILSYGFIYNTKKTSNNA